MENKGECPNETIQKRWRGDEQPTYPRTCAAMNWYVAQTRSLLGVLRNSGDKEVGK